MSDARDDIFPTARRPAAPADSPTPGEKTAPPARAPEPPPPASRPTNERVVLEFGSFREFIDDYSAYISPSGMFLLDSRHTVGERIAFEVRLSDDFRLIHGEGSVEWAVAAALPGQPAGVALRFTQLDEPSRRLVARLVDNHRSTGGTPFDIDEPPAAAVRSAVEEPGLPLSTGPGPETIALPISLAGTLDEEAAAAPVSAESDIATTDRPQPPLQPEIEAAPSVAPPPEPRVEVTPPVAPPPEPRVEVTPPVAPPSEPRVEVTPPAVRPPALEPEVAPPLKPEPEAAPPVAPGPEPEPPPVAAPPDLATSESMPLQELRESAQAAAESPFDATEVPLLEVADEPMPPPVLGEGISDLGPAAKEPAALGELPELPEPLPPTPTPPAAPSVAGASGFEPAELAAESELVAAGKPEELLPVMPLESEKSAGEPAAAPRGEQLSVAPRIDEVVASATAAVEAPAATVAVEMPDEEDLVGDYYRTSGPARRRTRSWLFLCLLAVTLGAAAWMYRDSWMGYLPESITGQSVETVAPPAPPASTPAPEAAAAGSEAALEDPAAIAADVPVVPATEDVAGTVPADVTSVATAPDEPTTEPQDADAEPDLSPTAADEVVAPAPSAPAAAEPETPAPSASVAPEPVAVAAGAEGPERVTELAFRVVDGVTEIRILTTSTIAPDGYQVVRVSQPPARQVIKIFGPEAPYPREAVAIGTEHVRRLRTGFHRVDGRGEIHVVADLTGPGVTVLGTEIRGSSLIVRFGMR